MKKIIALFLASGIASFSFAQTNGQPKLPGHQYIIKMKGLDPHRTDIYTFSAKQRDKQITKINSDFALNVKTIKSNRHISSAKKKNLIKKEKAQRDQQIKAVNKEYYNRYNTATIDKSYFDKQ